MNIFTTITCVCTLDHNSLRASSGYDFIPNLTRSALCRVLWGFVNDNGHLDAGFKNFILCRVWTTTDATSAMLHNINTERLMFKYLWHKAIGAQKRLLTCFQTSQNKWETTRGVMHSLFLREHELFIYLFFQTELSWNILILTFIDYDL